MRYLPLKVHALECNQTLPWISNMDLILINPVPLSNPLQTFLLVQVHANAHACNFSFRYCTILYEVSTCAELPDASTIIKHLPCEFHIKKLCFFFVYCKTLFKLHAPPLVVSLPRLNAHSCQSLKSLLVSQSMSQWSREWYHS